VKPGHTKDKTSGAHRKKTKIRNCFTDINDNRGMFKNPLQLKKAGKKTVCFGEKGSANKTTEYEKRKGVPLKRERIP